eukprot:824056-Amphidinium_carterae.1
MKILVKPGVERTDWPDGVPVSALSRSQRPPYISSMVSYTHPRGYLRRTNGRIGLKKESQKCGKTHSLNAFPCKALSLRHTSCTRHGRILCQSCLNFLLNRSGHQSKELILHQGLDERRKPEFMFNVRFQCKICNACSHNLPALIDHYTSRHFTIETHVAMQKRVNVSTQLSSRELGMALEIIKKHGKCLTPTSDYEAYRADVMTARGGQYQAQVASSPRHGNPVESMKNQCAPRIGDDQMGRLDTEPRESATGRSAPMK